MNQFSSNVNISVHILSTDTNNTLATNWFVWRYTCKGVSSAGPHRHYCRMTSLIIWNKLLLTDWGPVDKVLSSLPSLPPTRIDTMHHR